MSQPVVLIATITIDPRHRAFVEQALLEAVDAVRLEPGCEQYDLHSDVADLGRLVLLERWRDEAAIARHGEAPAFLALMNAFEGRATLSIVKLTRIVWSPFFHRSAP
jgi:quinol monooxygenase YgiN